VSTIPSPPPPPPDIHNKNIHLSLVGARTMKDDRIKLHQTSPRTDRGGRERGREDYPKENLRGLPLPPGAISDKRMKRCDGVLVPSPLLLGVLHLNEHGI
jgi:hypothetical protein